MSDTRELPDPADIAPEVLERIRQKFLRGQHLFNRAMREPTGANGRQKNLAASRAALQESLEQAFGQGVPPAEFPKWVYALVYGDGDAESIALQARDYQLTPDARSAALGG